MKTKFKNKVDIKLLLHKYLLWISMALSIFIFILGYALVIQPKLSKAKTDPNQSLQYVVQDLQSWDAKLKKLNSLTSRFKAFPPSHLRRVKEMLPTEFEAPLLYVHLDALAKANNSALLSVSVGDAGALNTEKALVDPNGFNLHAIDVQASFLLNPGNYDYAYYKQLLNAIENDLRLFDIESISYAPQMQSLDVSGKMYYLKTNEK